MKYQYSLALHDLKISGNADTVDKIKNVLGIFRVPLTVHLVFDAPLIPGTELAEFIRENTGNGRLEVVFHGLNHRCSVRVWKMLSWYHKYQGEYLVDSEDLRKNSGEMYLSLNEKLGFVTGFCPPCWIINRRNLRFFKSLNPLYIESLLFLTARGRKFFSSVISLGSPVMTELFFLRKLGYVILYITLFFRMAKVRVVVHECDLDIRTSMKFFLRITRRLNKRRYIPVRQKDMIV